LWENVTSGEDASSVLIKNVHPKQMRAEKMGTLTTTNPAQSEKLGSQEPRQVELKVELDSSLPVQYSNHVQFLSTPREVFLDVFLGRWRRRQR
jgi:hypothetical protein